LKKAVVLLSGGLDSSVAAYVARKDIGKTGELYTISFPYGQPSIEADCSEKISKLLAVKEHWYSCPVGIPVTGTEGGVFKPFEDVRETGVEEGIANTWVPQRNSIFLALAFAYAESIGADFIYTGLNSKDYSGYPDCRPAFVESINKSLNLASKRFIETGRGIGIICPLMRLTKKEIVLLGLKLGVPFKKTWSCYQLGPLACGKCDSCRLRLQGFEQAGLIDPLKYR